MKLLTEEVSMKFDNHDKKNPCLKEEGSLPFDNCAVKSERGDGDNKSVETYENLKPLKYLLAFFGIICPFKLSKKTAILCIIYWLVIIGHVVFCFYKGVVCLIGTDIAMDDSNVSLYILALIGYGMILICVSFGTFYAPNRYRRFVITLEELILDRQPFEDLRKKSRVLISLVVTLFFVLILPSMSAGPPFTTNYICYTSPFNWTSPYAEIQNTVSSFSALFLFCKRIVFHGFTYFICNIIKKEFLQFDEEFRKMLDKEPTKKNIRYFQRRYFLICRHLQEADDLLCPFLTTLLFGLISTVCLLMRTVTYGNLSKYYMAIYIGVMPVALVEICFILLQGSRIHNSSKRCLSLIHDIDGNKMNVKSLALITLFADNVRHSDFGLSIMKLFILNNSVIVTIIGTLVSYTVVIVQFQF